MFLRLSIWWRMHLGLSRLDYASLTLTLKYNKFGINHYISVVTGAGQLSEKIVTH